MHLSRLGSISTLHLWCLKAAPSASQRAVYWCSLSIVIFPVPRQICHFILSMNILWGNFPFGTIWNLIESKIFALQCSFVTIQIHRERFLFSENPGSSAAWRFLAEELHWKKEFLPSLLPTASYCLRKVRRGMILTFSSILRK